MARPDAPALFALASLFAALAALVYLLLGAPALHVPLGRLPAALTLDGLSGFFLLLVLAAATPKLGWAEMAQFAGTLLALFADDGLTLAGGVAVAALGMRRPVAAVPVVLLALACILLGPGDFSHLRAIPPETGRAVAGMLLALAAAACLGGPLGLYLVLRLPLDLAGPLPAWAGLLPMAAGAGLALLGGWTARHGRDSGFARLLLGLATLAAGVALSARAVDLAPLAGQALAAALLAAAASGLALPLLGRGTVPGLAGAFALAFVPPGLGFAALWTLLRALQATPPPGGAVFGPAIQAGAMVALAGAAVLGAAGALRLGRDALAGPPAALGRITALAALALLAGIFPAPVLLLADPASQVLIGAPATLAQGYLPWAIAILLAGFAALAVLLRRRAAPAGPRLAAAWHGGAAAELPILPPPAPPALRLPIRWRLPPGWERHVPTAAILAAALALLLLAVTRR